MSVPAVGGAANLEKQGPVITVGKYLAYQFTLSQQNKKVKGKR